MKNNPNRLITGLFCAGILIKGLIIAHIAMASNEAFKINAAEDDGQTRVMLTFKDRPSYSLKAMKDNHLLLTLHDTIKGNGFEKKLQEGKSFTIIEDPNPVAIKLDIGLQRPFYKIDSSWIEDKKLLYVHIYTQEIAVNQAKSPPVITTLQDIRFGFLEKGTRMLMTLNNNPLWEMELQNPSKIRMHLTDVSDSLKKIKYGPIKRLKDVNINKGSDKGAEITLGLESPLNHVSVFSMTTEGRLVMDLLDEPEKISENELTINNQNPDALILKKDNQAQKTANMGNFVKMKINKNKGPDNVLSSNASSSGASLPAAAPAAAAPAAVAPVATAPAAAPVAAAPVAAAPAAATPVASAPAAAPDASSSDKTPVSGVKTDSPVKIEPKINEALPMSSELKKSIDGLNPEEAFLYGRIKQAMEINDYEKGIALVNQFLNESPDSALSEDILFLKGDFYYCLWKNGDNEVSGNVISSYQKAIDRFPESELAPLSYIKMAQAGSSREEEYMAIGYLGIVMNRKKKSDLMPLAYLTRGKIFLRLNQPEKAIADFKIILEQYKRSAYAPEANFWIASYYHSVGLYEDAEKKLKEISDSNPDIHIEHPEYFFLCAKNYLYLKNYDMAREYLFKAVNIGRQQEGVDMLLTRIGDTYHNQENKKEAEKYYRMVVDYYPGTEGASISKLRLADYNSDMTVLEDLSNNTGNGTISELAVLEKGYQLLEKKQYSAVIDTVKQLAVKPVQTETRKNARSLFFNAAEKEITRLFQEGKYKDLIEFYTPINGLMNDNINPEIMLSVAVSFNRLHLNEQAISAFGRIKSQDLNLQSRGSYYLGLAESYFEKGDKSNSRNLLERARNYDLESADKQRISKSLAMLYKDDGRLNDAYLLCQAIITDKNALPDNEMVDVHILMGKILNLQKKYGEALKIINSAPGMPDKIGSDLLKSAYMETGKAQYSMGEYADAIKSYEDAFDLGYGPENQDYWDARFNLALAYTDAGEDRKAKALFTEISGSGDAILQQRAQLKLGTMDLEKQLQRLPSGGTKEIDSGND